MNDLSEIKRANDAHAAKFGKAAGIADRLAQKAAKQKRVAESQQRARLLSIANKRIKTI